MRASDFFAWQMSRTTREQDEAQKARDEAKATTAQAEHAIAAELKMYRPDANVSELQDHLVEMLDTAALHPEKREQTIKHIKGLLDNLVLLPSED